MAAKKAQDDEAIGWICDRMDCVPARRFSFEWDYYGENGMRMLSELFGGTSSGRDEVDSEAFAVRVLEILKADHGLVEHFPLDISDWLNWEEEDEAAEALAFRRGRLKVLGWLLENGGDPDSVFRGGDHLPLLVEAARSRPGLALDLVGRGANVFAQDSSGYSAIFVLAQLGQAKWEPAHGELAKAVMEKGAALALDGAGNTALHHCVFCSNETMARMLLEKEPSLMGMRNRASKTAFELARDDNYPLAGFLGAFGQSLRDKEALLGQEEERAKRLARLGELAEALMKEGRLSVDGVAVKGQEDLESFAPGAPKRARKL